MFLNINKLLIYFIELLLIEYLSCESLRFKRGIKDSDDTRKLPKNLKYYIEKRIPSCFIEMALQKTEKETCFKFKRTSKISNDGKTLEFYKNEYSVYAIQQNGSLIRRQLMISKNDLKSSGKIQRVLSYFFQMTAEISRYDRDKYVKVHHENMINGEFIKFDPLSNEKYPTFNVGYDFSSLLQFHPKYESKNNKNTIEAHISYYNKMMGQTEEFSFNNYKLINKYFCSKRCSSKIVCHNSGYQNPNNCKICKCPNGYKGKYCQNIKSSTSKCGKTHLNAYEKIKILKANGKKTCTYIIKVPHRYIVKIFITHVKTKSRKICMQKKGLEIKYRNDKGAAGLNLCGTYKNISLKSNSRTVLIQYNGKQNNNKFSIKFKRSRK